MTMATPSSREAFLPSRVMDGAMKPMTISGTQNVISWPMMYCSVTTTFMAPSGKICPSSTPTTMPSNSRNGRLFSSFFIWFLSLSYPENPAQTLRRSKLMGGSSGVGMV